MMGRSLRGRLIQALKHAKTIKSNKTMEYVGCSKEELISHLESKFTEGMSWENYGKWHIDHIKPVCLFDLTKNEEIFKMMNYSNLQPLWAKDNRVKNKKFSPTD